MLKIKVILVIVLAIVAGLFVRQHNQTNLASQAAVAVNAAKDSAASATQQIQKPNACKDNTLDKEVIISISAQHMWACTGTTTEYDNPVVTGMEKYPNDLTPPGTYKIYAKQTNTRLTGSDQFGSWDDPVSYWMPFLSNNYGVYGFHDATWRAASDFGKINIHAPFTTTAKSGSHGCVEMPLTAMKWLYDWSSVGTTVVIQS